MNVTAKEYLLSAPPPSDNLTSNDLTPKSAKEEVLIFNSVDVYVRKVGV